MHCNCNERKVANFSYFCLRMPILWQNNAGQWDCDKALTEQDSAGAL